MQRLLIRATPANGNIASHYYNTHNNAQHNRANQVGNTCGLCAFLYVLQYMYGRIESELDILHASRRYIPTTLLYTLRELSFIGEIFHPTQFVEFIQIHYAVNCRVEPYNIASVINIINSGGLVIAPFNTTREGFPVNYSRTDGNAHWCVIAGYRYDREGCHLLAKHWGKNFDFNEQDFSASNNHISDYLWPGKNPIYSSSYPTFTVDHAFSKRELYEVKNLSGKMIIFPPLPHPIRRRRNSI